jgi:hypothetical protein
MKSWKLPLLIVCIIFSAAATFFITSCEKDACTDVQCQNGGSCGGGFCHCPVGYEGAVCETKSLDKFIGTYYGTVRCDKGGAFLVDTLQIWFLADPDQVTIVRHSNISDTIFATVRERSLYIPDVVTENTARYANGEYNNGHLIFTTHIVSNIAKEEQTVCTFEGEKGK